MKLSKAKQQELDTAYKTLIQVCLYDMPIGEMEPLLADDVMNFGAGKKEITKTKAAFLKQIKNQKKLAAGLKMDFKFKPVLRKIINKGNGAIYTDDILNTVWINGVENKLKFRLSFIFEYRQHKWVMVHSHTSTPDNQRSDDEVWPVEELKKRTAVLEKSLDEKIAELEIKNRELEVEAALEKVRSRSLAMYKSDEMQEVVNTVFESLKSLEIDMNVASIFIFKEGSKDWKQWVATSTTNYSTYFHIPYVDLKIFRDLEEAKQNGKDYYSLRYSFEEKNEWFTYAFANTEYNRIPDERKQFLIESEFFQVSFALAKI